MSYSAKGHADPAREARRPRPPSKAPQQSTSSKAQRIQIEQVVQRRAAKSSAEGATSSGGVSGLPARLRAGVEALSGFAMGDVRVHRNSAEPAKLGALAYTMGSEIHLGPGQEQHLPHEAWHVVQQKQGRAQSTTQMKGVGINDDAGLEAEADRLGKAAAVGNSTGLLPRQPIRPLGSQIVQVKVEHNGKTVTYADSAGSKLLGPFIDTDETFILRNDWEAPCPDVFVNLLIKDRRYILGEDHSKSTFEMDAGYWPEATRVQENRWEIPETKANPPFGAKSTEGIWMAMFGYTGIPLESSHTFMISRAFTVNNRLNAIVTGQPQYNISQQPGLDPSDTIKTMMFVATEYQWFTETRRQKDDFPSQYSPIYAFSDSLTKEYLSKLKLIVDCLYLLDQAEKTLSKQPTNATASTVRTNALAGIARDQEVFSKIIRDVQVIVGMAPSSKEGKIINAGLESSKFSIAATVALHSWREEGMAKRALAADAPALVKLGDLHADHVAELVGVSAIKARWPTKLWDLTYWTTANWSAMKAKMAALGPFPPLRDPDKN